MSKEEYIAIINASLPACEVDVLDLILNLIDYAIKE